MNSFPSPHHLRDGAPVHLRLSRSARSLADTIQEIHQACDLAEDAGPGTALLVHIQDSERDLLTGDMDMPVMSQWERALKRIELLRVPTICVVEGACFGLMFDVLLCTDHRVVTPRLELGLAHVGDTMWPGMAIHRLATQIGVAQARPLVLFDARLDAEDARRLGLVHAITLDPVSAAYTFIAALAAARVNDVSIRRQLLLEAAGASHESVLGSHMAACDRALRRAAAPAKALAAVAALANP
jgi:isomerase DpgB